MKPKIGHLRICGCLVYIHVPEEKGMKLEPSREKGVFVGYNETSKDYRIFMLNSSMVEDNCLLRC